MGGESSTATQGLRLFVKAYFGCLVSGSDSSPLSSIDAWRSHRGRATSGCGLVGSGAVVDAEGRARLDVSQSARYGMFGLSKPTGSPRSRWAVGVAMSQEERIAENEAFCRDLNRSKDDWLRSGLQVAGFRCECWRIDCSVRIRLSRQEWREVRSRPERFAVAPGHTAIDVEPGVEEVVKKYDHFWLVEKRGRAGEIAAKRE